MSTRTKQRARQARQVIAAQHAAERRRRMLVTSAVVAALLLVAGLIGYGVYVNQRPEQVNAPREAVQSGTGLSVGDGPVTVDLYVDFLCPACKQYEEQASPTLHRYLDEGKITLVYHPLNILDRLSTTDYSTRAGAAAAVAAEEGTLLEYAEALFAQQPPEGGAGLTDQQLIEIGRSVGLTSDRFAKAVTSDKYHDWMTYVTAKADERGVRGTPTVLVNGEPVESTVTALTTAIDAT
ncbi:MAG: DsbA family protein [Micromonosporaceae bacterium]